MRTYIIVYDDYKYGICSNKYKAGDIFEALNQFMCEGHGDLGIISITVGV